MESPTIKTRKATASALILRVLSEGTGAALATAEGTKMTNAASKSVKFPSSDMVLSTVARLRVPYPYFRPGIYEKQQILQ